MCCFSISSLLLVQVLLACFLLCCLDGILSSAAACINQTICDFIALICATQRVFKEYAQHDAQERQRLRDDEEGERIERFNELSCVRQNRAAAEDEADRCEEIRRLAEEEANRSEYKRAERDALEMEAVIKQLEMECLTRGMSHQL